MKLFTYWWGVHLVSEDEDEVAILMDLYKRLQNPSEEREVYEEGTVELYLPYDSTIRGDFSYKIEDGDVVLEINR